MQTDFNSKIIGDKGEDLACGYLVKNGYKILGRNYRITFGEIYIIAKKRDALGDVIHFVEVKTLSGTGNFYPEEHVDYKKQNKYRKLAEIWLEKNKFTQDYPCQVDIIAVTMDNQKIDHFENIISN